jgi:hypothetical protein
MELTRQEHLEWCKKRALEYADRGYVQEAFSSMASDLSKHPETEKHPGIELGLMFLMFGSIKTQEQMIRFIEGFN